MPMQSVIQVVSKVGRLLNLSSTLFGQILIRTSKRVVFDKLPHEDLKKKGSSSGTRGGSSDQEMGDVASLQNGGVIADQERVVRFLAERNNRRHLILARMVLAEMIGTFILMFSVSGILACSKLSQGNVGLMEYASTGCFALIIVLFSIGPISGAHVNPSITIAYATIGRFPWSKVPFYVSAQMLASVLAAYVGKLVYNMPADFAATRPVNGRARAFWAELIATSFIMFLASALSINAQAIGQSAGFALGAAIALSVMITGPVSGGSMNPARSFGPAVISWRFEDLWLYFLAPTAGAIAGALLFRSVQFQHQHSDPVSSSDASPAN